MLLKGAACCRESTAIAIATDQKKRLLTVGLDDEVMLCSVATREKINTSIMCFQKRGETIDLRKWAGSACLSALSERLKAVTPLKWMIVGFAGSW